MSLRLWIASTWTPRSSLRRELLHVEEVTNAALDDLLRQRIPAYRPEELGRADTGIADLRSRMAKGHRGRVELLIRTAGSEEALAAGREALFQAGLRLGQEARARLGVRDIPNDLLRAARIMYRVLGIEFKMTLDDGRGEMTVYRCALAGQYTADTCAILSATDEGVVHGLSRKAKMRFTRHITAGNESCIAEVNFTEG